VDEKTTVSMLLYYWRIFVKERMKMGMPLELNTMIVTKGKENRVKENTFILVKDGYRLYPIGIPLEIRKTKESDPSGMAIIQKLELENDQTTITYQLVSLYSIN
jgi:hypothetical protein